jgi:starch synthase
VVPLLPNKANANRATGFRIREHTAESVISALRDAIEVFEDVPIWNRLVDNGMRVDVSWARSAKAYERLFNRVVGVT